GGDSGGDDGGEDSGGDSGGDDGGEDSGGDSGGDDGGEDSGGDGALAGGGDGTATLTLDNGEVFEFGILCALEPQEAAGSEILFTVVSYDDPYNLDVTQFGADSFNGAANISLYDSTTFDTIWEASGFLGAEVELNLDGSTVTGSGTFHPDGDPSIEGVSGELTASC
ncbi:MAG: hypothetical protein OEU32_14025, partial [Acidimicrobiia bacterium]|nr:hypothetical protein [Acidimicrobiia bacterium]